MNSKIILYIYFQAKKRRVFNSKKKNRVYHKINIFRFFNLNNTHYLKGVKHR